MPTVKIDDPIVKLIVKACKGPNYLTRVLRGHHALARLLGRAIEVYSHARSQEARRLSFSLKTEIALVLGAIGSDSVPLYRVFNKIRNRFAHNPFAVFRASDSRDMANCISPEQRRIVLLSDPGKRPLDLGKRRLLERCVLAMSAELGGSIRQKITSDVAAKLSMEEVGPLVDAIKKTGALDDRLKEFDRQVQEIAYETPTIDDN